MTIRYVREDASRALISHELAAEATRVAFLAATDPDNATFAVVSGHGYDKANRFSIKSAVSAKCAGLKVGSYWPRNSASGRPRHNSCIFLIDQESGRIESIVEAGAANGFRTAAGDAIAVERLARDDARHLTVFGAGHQARYECEALMRVRRLHSISIVNRDAEKARLLAESLGNRVEVSVLNAETACRRADIIVTVTAAREPLLSAAWIKPGTHISCMGSDAQGKQEVPRDLLLKADLFCDYAPQSLAIGEFQHIADAVDGGQAKLTNIGEVLSGRAVGRRNAEAITIFDSSGLALQDIFLAHRLLGEAEKRGLIEIWGA